MDTPQPTADTQTPPRGRAADGRRALWILLIALMGVYAYTFWPRHASIAWETDLAQALEQARTREQPLLVEFQAAWCGPCNQMKREVFPRRDVGKALADWVAVQIDVDAQPEIRRQYRVDPIPTFVVLAPDGTELRRVEGSMSASEFIAFLADVDPRRQRPRMSR